MIYCAYALYDLSPLSSNPYLQLFQPAHEPSEDKRLFDTSAAVFPEPTSLAVQLALIGWVSAYARILQYRPIIYAFLKYNAPFD